MPLEAGAIYVFELRFHDYLWWARMDAAGCRTVPRFKAYTPPTVTAEFDVPQAHAVLSDRIGLLPKRRASNSRSPFGDPVRGRQVRTETGKVLRILCKDLDASAHEICNLNKRCWNIELFFRWVKQTLKIRHFLGTSENAVRIQIAVALIAFLLLRLAASDQKRVQSPLAFARLVRLPLHPPARH